MKAFSNEITIGTSAPPTGSTNNTPNNKDKIAKTNSGVVPSAITTHIALTIVPNNVAAITKRPPGKTTGRVVINSCNFKNVIMEPEKETHPTSTVNTVATTTPVDASVPSFKYSTIATSAAAPPPTPLNNATSCGIAVI